MMTYEFTHDLRCWSILSFQFLESARPATIHCSASFVLVLQLSSRCFPTVSVLRRVPDITRSASMDLACTSNSKSNSYILLFQIPFLFLINQRPLPNWCCNRRPKCTTGMSRLLLLQDVGPPLLGMSLHRQITVLCAFTTVIRTCFTIQQFFSK